MARHAGRLIAVLLLVAAVIGGAIGWGWWRYTAPGPLSSGTTVIIPKGSGLGAIAGALADAGVISGRLVFMAAMVARGDARGLRAGEYAFAPRQPMRAVAAQMLAGHTVQRRLTIPEGLTSVQVVALLADAGGLSGPLPDKIPEGALLPDTYFFSYGDDRAALLARMERAMSETMAELWPARSADLATPEQAVILASIVERETAVAAERPRVAAVFLNRLKRGMRLQSDPTVIYAVTEGKGVLDRPLSRADLAAPSPYNTYLNEGLPPGPIANPGRAAIEAVLRPAATDDLYFVADGAGGHVFSRTLAEHNRHVVRWRKLRDGRDRSAPVEPDGGTEPGRTR